MRGAGVRGRAWTRVPEVLIMYRLGERLQIRRWSVLLGINMRQLTLSSLAVGWGGLHGGKSLAFVLCWALLAVALCWVRGWG